MLLLEITNENDSKMRGVADASMPVMDDIFIILAGAKVSCRDPGMVVMVDPLSLYLSISYFIC